MVNYFILSNRILQLCLHVLLICYVVLNSFPLKLTCIIFLLHAGIALIALTNINNKHSVDLTMFHSECLYIFSKFKQNCNQ